MAITFDQVKTNIPGVGERAYLFAQYSMVNNLCTPNPFNVARQCMFLGGAATGSEWAPGAPWEGIFPNVGDYVTTEQLTPSLLGGYNTSIMCYKVLAIIDEPTFNTGTCVECYNNGAAGNCSNVFISPPPYPGDPNGCFYNNSINNAGIAVASSSWQANQAAGVIYNTYIQNDCQDCVAGIPPNFVPNTIVNCCDPSEVYTLEPPSINWPVYNELVNLGVYNDQQAFRADFYIGGAQTGMKCWHLEERTNTFGASVISVVFDPGDIFPDCGHLENFLTNSPNYNPCCTPPPDPCPPQDQNSPFYTNNSEFCFGCVTPGAFYFGHPDCPCCDPTGTTTETGCTLPTATLRILQDKVNDWKEWRDRTFSNDNINSPGNPLGSVGGTQIVDRDRRKRGESMEDGKPGGNNQTRGNTQSGGQDYQIEEPREDTGRDRRDEGGGMSEAGGGY